MTEEGGIKMDRKKLKEGRPKIFHDQFHTVMLDRQNKYNDEIYAIMEELKCSYLEARKVRIERKKKIN